MASAKKLTAKQEKFCLEYMVDLNATQAAIRAGYSEKTAQVIGAENLIKPMIANRINEMREEQAKRTQISADFVLGGLKQIATEALDLKEYDAASIKALELLGKHLKLFTDKQELTGADGGAIKTEAEFKVSFVE